MRSLHLYFIVFFAVFHISEGNMSVYAVPTRQKRGAILKKLNCPHCTSFCVPQNYNSDLLQLWHYNPYMEKVTYKCGSTLDIQENVHMFLRVNFGEQQMYNAECEDKFGETLKIFDGNQVDFKNTINSTIIKFHGSMRYEQDWNCLFETNRTEEARADLCQKLRFFYKPIACTIKIRIIRSDFDLPLFRSIYYGNQIKSFECGNEITIKRNTISTATIMTNRKVDDAWCYKNKNRHNLVISDGTMEHLGEAVRAGYYIFTEIRGTKENEGVWRCSFLVNDQYGRRHTTNCSINIVIKNSMEKNHYSTPLIDFYTETNIPSPDSVTGTLDDSNVDLICSVHFGNQTNNFECGNAVTVEENSISTAIIMTNRKVDEAWCDKNRKRHDLLISKRPEEHLGEIVRAGHLILTDIHGTKENEGVWECYFVAYDQNGKKRSKFCPIFIVIKNLREQNTNFPTPPPHYSKITNRPSPLPVTIADRPEKKYTTTTTRPSVFTSTNMQKDDTNSSCITTYIYIGASVLLMIIIIVILVVLCRKCKVKRNRNDAIRNRPRRAIPIAYQMEEPIYYNDYENLSPTSENIYAEVYDHIEHLVDRKSQARPSR